MHHQAAQKTKDLTAGLSVLKHINNIVALLSPSHSLHLKSLGLSDDNKLLPQAGIESLPTEPMDLMERGRYYKYRCNGPKSYE